MINNRDQVDLAVRAGLVAKSVLQLMACNSKTLARFIMAEALDLLADLDQKIKELPEEK